MNEIESILDECLRRMSSEGVSVESLLALYPEHAATLRPLLMTAMRVRAASRSMSGPDHPAEARKRLLGQIAARPPRRTSRTRLTWRMAIAVASLSFFALAATTAYAQAALPGQALYGWKLRSEIIWRTMSTDRVGVDLSLAVRRSDELTSVGQDPVRLGKARDGFHEVLDRLEAEKDAQNSAKIDNALKAHHEKLEKEGIRDSRLDELVRGKGNQKP